jgi:hypothetical protein
MNQNTLDLKWEELDDNLEIDEATLWQGQRESRVLIKRDSLSSTLHAFEEGPQLAIE